MQSGYVIALMSIIIFGVFPSRNFLKRKFRLASSSVVFACLSLSSSFLTLQVTFNSSFHYTLHTRRHQFNEELITFWKS